MKTIVYIIGGCRPRS